MAGGANYERRTKNVIAAPRAMRGVGGENSPKRAAKNSEK
jgi:hypothetical protein